MCFVDLEKAFDRVPRVILWEVLQEYGVRGPLLRAVQSLYDRNICSSAMNDVSIFAPIADMQSSNIKTNMSLLDNKLL